MATLMMCGHTATGTRSTTGEPVCVVCVGIVPGADQPAPEPDLTDRTATCCYCNRQSKSSIRRLPFFEYRPGMDTDRYYCGCKGWD